MFNKTLKLISSVLMTAIIGTVSGCHSGKVARAPIDPTRSQQASTELSSFVGTVPVPGIGEQSITPRETVGAAPD